MQRSRTSLYLPDEELEDILDLYDEAAGMWLSPGYLYWDAFYFWQSLKQYLDT